VAALPLLELRHEVAASLGAAAEAATVVEHRVSGNGATLRT
jgi:hypothetical protein